MLFGDSFSAFCLFHVEFQSFFSFFSQCIFHSTQEWAASLCLTQSLMLKMNVINFPGVEGVLGMSRLKKHFETTPFQISNRSIWLENQNGSATIVNTASFSPDYSVRSALLTHLSRTQSWHRFRHLQNDKLK